MCDENLGECNLLSGGLITSHFAPADMSSLPAPDEESGGAVPDAARVTMGLIVLRVSNLGVVEVGNLPPGSPVAISLQWKTYNPGECCLCFRKVASLLWEGVRRDRPFLPQVQPRPTNQSVELAGACRVCFLHWLLEGVWSLLYVP